MKLSRLITAALCTSTLLAAAAPLSAHGIWFAQRARQLALIYGVGADDLDAVKRLPLIKSVTGYDADFAPVATRLREAGVIPVVDSDEPVAAVAAIMDYGLWSKTPDGEWHNKGRDEVPTATLANDVTATVEYDRYYPATINDADAAHEALAAAATVDDAQLATEPAFTSEDFAFMLQACKGAYIWLGQARPEGSVPLHNPHYDFNDDVLGLGIRLHVALVEQHLVKD